MTMNRLNIVLLTLLFLCLASAAAMRTDPATPNWDFLPDMQYSPASDAYRLQGNLPGGIAPTQPPGTIARGQTTFHYEATPLDAIRAGEELTNPIPAADVAAAVIRGGEIYRVHCAMCHGPRGLGDGPVAKRGFPPPPPLPTGKSLQMKDGQLFHILTVGQGSMAPFATQLSPADRWAAIAFVRELQAAAKAAIEPAKAESKAKK